MQTAEGRGMPEKYEVFSFGGFLLGLCATY
jgi:hypothetical protein